MAATRTGSATGLLGRSGIGGYSLRLPNDYASGQTSVQLIRGCSQPCDGNFGEPRLHVCPLRGAHGAGGRGTPAAASWARHASMASPHVLWNSPSTAPDGSVISAERLNAAEPPPEKLAVTAPEAASIMTIAAPPSGPEESTMLRRMLLSAGVVPEQA